jgi:hypothetical protein
LSYNPFSKRLCVLSTIATKAGEHDTPGMLHHTQVKAMVARLTAGDVQDLDLV